MCRWSCLKASPRPPSWEREDPRDAALLVSGQLRPRSHDMPAGTVVGTSGLRRRCAALRTRYPHLAGSSRCVAISTPGWGKLSIAATHGAIIPAAAGLKRAGPGRDRIRAVLDPGRPLPAAGQGALGIEIPAGASRSWPPPGWRRFRPMRFQRAGRCSPKSAPRVAHAGRFLPGAAGSPRPRKPGWRNAEDRGLRGLCSDAQPPRAGPVRKRAVEGADFLLLRQAEDAGAAAGARDLAAGRRRSRDPGDAFGGSPGPPI
ncbi:hypothetical protein ACU4GD_15585 [Cupriavidus basilensis]